jgi:hypothetical protein
MRHRSSQYAMARKGPETGRAVQCWSTDQPCTPLKQARTVWHGTIGREQHHLSALIRKAEGQHFRPEFSDLTRRKIDDRGYLSAEERCRLIMARDLCARLFHADTGSEVYSQLHGWFARLGKRLRRNYGADADIDRQELLERDGRRGWRARVVQEMHGEFADSLLDGGASVRENERHLELVRRARRGVGAPRGRRRGPERSGLASSISRLEARGHGCAPWGRVPVHRKRAGALQRALFAVIPLRGSRVSTCFVEARRHRRAWHGCCKHRLTDIDSKSERRLAQLVTPSRRCVRRRIFLKRRSASAVRSFRASPSAGPLSAT